MVPVFAFVAMLVSFLCALAVFIHAFRRSVGTGFMVVCIPFFGLYYAVMEFEHRRKGWLVAGFVGGWALAAMLALSGGYGLEGRSLLPPEAS